MDEDDFDLSLSPVRKQTAIKQGRRAASNGPSNAFVVEDPGNLSSLKPRSHDLFSSEPLPSTQSNRRNGVWSQERSRTKSAFSERRLENTNEGGVKDNDVKDDDDDDDVVPIIPDLDEVQEEDLAMQVADAPAVPVNRVATYQELDNDLLKHAAFATLDDIDLRLLTRGMVPESALKEPDEPWTWEILFAEVGGELQTEWYPEETEPSESNRPYTAFNRLPV